MLIIDLLKVAPMQVGKRIANAQFSSDCFQSMTKSYAIPNPTYQNTSLSTVPHSMYKGRHKHEAVIMSLQDKWIFQDNLSEDRAFSVRESLRNAIIDRRLAPGTKLSEAEVGELFDVSRTVVRSALQMLAFEGLIKTERNRGAFVSNPTPEEARQVFAARRMIEPGIVLSAVERLTEPDLTLFQQHLEDEERHLNARGPAARRAEIKASGDFHLLLAKVAGNAILQKFMDELVARSSLVIALYGGSGISSCGHNEHHGILDALRNRDAATASALMLHHIDHIEADLDLRLREGLALKDALGL
ncbi:DNA-binding GntR family transcriptional regulator [Rhizobium paknamense]|uniref:DNA-binding GntR family transcriptional regulator n=2 Tax=Rhizobium paknamense TaxID=1206817 RepID=A0ABU0IE07_9HYPH|nr:DNA-binding GntR family transcriptional regulator [Rhizobium paknamense]